MKKTLVLLLATIGLASASQAVIISWAVSTPLGDATSAELVYVATGVPTASGFTTLTTGMPIGSQASVMPWGVGEQDTTDPTTETGGNYFVVLFSGNNLLAYYNTPLAYNDGTDITSNEMSPATGVFDPSTGGSTPIPEPCSMALLCVGAATLVIRRRKKLCV
jgi:hypothetical protein